MNKLIIDVASEKIFLMIITNNDIYNIIYENTKINYEKLTTIINDFLKTKNLKIKNISKIKLSNKEFIYHAGTKLFNNELRSIGGRVLNITSIGSNFLKIRKNIISIIKKINWKSGFYRKDIGWKVINKNENY